MSDIEKTDRKEAGLQTIGSRSVSGSYPYAGRDTAEVFDIRIHGISEE